MTDDIREAMADAYRRSERNAIERMVAEATRREPLIEIREQTIRKCAWLSWYTYNHNRAERLAADDRAQREVERIEYEIETEAMADSMDDILDKLRVVGEQMRAHDVADGYEPDESEVL